MPKQTVSFGSRAFFMEPILASVLSHAHIYSEWFAADPAIALSYKGRRLGPAVHLSEIAGLDPRAKAAYDALQILHQMKSFGLHKWDGSIDLSFIKQALNPADRKRPYTFRYCSPLKKVSSFVPVEVVPLTDPQDPAKVILEVRYE